MQMEEVIFQKMLFTIVLDEYSYDGNVEYDEGGDYEGYDYDPE